MHARLRIGAYALGVGLLALLLAAFVLVSPWQARIDVGDVLDHAFVRNVHGSEYSPEHQVHFRWTGAQSTLFFPGAGQLTPLTLRVHGDNAHMPPIGVDVGTGLQTIVLRQGWQHIALLPRPQPWSGNVLVHIEAPVQTSIDDERERGIVLEHVILHGNPACPVLGQPVLIGLYAALATLLTGWATRRVWAGVIVGLLLAIGSAVVLGMHHGAWRLFLTCATGRLTFALLCGGMLALVIERILAWRGVAVAALISFLLRFGGMAYPLNFISDIRFSMARATMVREGDLPKLFLPNPSLTPVQWETSATVPRSPLYYILTAPLTALPGELDRLAMMAFSSAIDAIAAVAVGLIVLQVGGNRRTASIAACMAALLPLGVIMAMSWGIFPTLLAQCFMLVAMFVWIHHAGYERPWVGVAGALTLAAVAYPTALLFLGTTFALLLALLLFQRNPYAMPTFLAGVLAFVASMLLFYGWHIPAMVENTLPELSGRLLEHGTGSSTTFSVRISNIIDPIWKPLQAKYGMLICGLASGGLLLLLIKPLNTRAQNARLLILAWLATYPLMTLMSRYVVTFILKDVLYMLPLLALLSGLLLGRLARCRWGMVVVGAILATVFWESLQQELHAIIYAFAQLK